MIRPMVDHQGAHRRELLVANGKFTALALVVIAVAIFSSRRLGRLDELPYWSAGISLAFVPLLLYFIFSSAKDGTPRYVRAHLAYSGVIAASMISVAVATLLFAMIATIGYVGRQASGWVERADMSGRPLWILVTALSTAVLGAGFFYFRLRQRLLYGATEALAGIAVAAHRTSVEPGTGLPSETGFYFAVLTAGVYLVVRGLDNMHQAYRGDDPLARLLRRTLGDTTVDKVFVDRPR